MSFDVFIKCDENDKLYKNICKNVVLMFYIDDRMSQSHLKFNSELNCFQNNNVNKNGIYKYIESMSIATKKTPNYFFEFKYKEETKYFKAKNNDCDNIIDIDHGKTLDNDILMYIKSGFKYNTKHSCFHNLLSYCNEKHLKIISTQNIIHDRERDFITSIDLMAIRSYDSKLFVIELKCTKKKIAIEKCNNIRNTTYLMINQGLCVYDNYLNRQLLQIYLIKKCFEKQMYKNPQDTNNVEFVLLRVSKNYIVEYNLSIK